MAKLSDKDINGTSFYGSYIDTSINELVGVLGEPQYSDNQGEDINFMFDCETENGDVFTIYDIHKNRPIKRFEEVRFHIGGFSKSVTEQAKEELIKLGV